MGTQTDIAVCERHRPIHNDIPAIVQNSIGIGFALDLYHVGIINGHCIQKIAGLRLVRCDEGSGKVGMITVAVCSFHYHMYLMTGEIQCGSCRDVHPRRLKLDPRRDHVDPAGGTGIIQHVVFHIHHAVHHQIAQPCHL